MHLVILLVIGKPHALPLLLADRTGLDLLALDGGKTEDDARLLFRSLGLEDDDTVDLGQLLRRGLTLEQILLQLGMVVGNGIVFLCQLLTHTVGSVILPLLHHIEEPVHIRC